MAILNVAAFHGLKSRERDLYKKAASDIPDAALANGILSPLEREVNPGANHAEVVMRPVHKIPAEVTDPANVRSEANFHAATNLADCPRLGAGLFSANDSVVHDNVRFFASTKDSASSAKKVRREARAGNRIA